MHQIIGTQGTTLLSPCRLTSSDLHRFPDSLLEALVVDTTSGGTPMPIELPHAFGPEVYVPIIFELHRYARVPHTAE